MRMHRINARKRLSTGIVSYPFSSSFIVVQVVVVLGSPPCRSRAAPGSTGMIGDRNDLNG